VITASLVTSIVSELHRLPPLLVYGLVALFVFGEAALFLGFVLPGETTVIVGGVIASQGSINVTVLATLVVIAAIGGDSVGYLVGRRFGPQLLELRPIRKHRQELDDALVSLQRRGALYVFIGRFTSFLRAVMPGLAGMSRLEYRRFLVANASGGLLWGLGFTLLGYLGGKQLPRIEKYIGYFGSGLLAVLAVVVVSLFVRRRAAQRRSDTQ
jgi:membrane protein DedA with SNARE-associated domain